MNSFIFLPLQFLQFWFFDSPRKLLHMFFSFNKSLVYFFSLPVLVKTFFKPLKNEYRPGLVRFARVMGICIKSVLIPVDIVFLLIVYIVELIIFFGFITFPFLTIGLLIW